MTAVQEATLGHGRRSRAEPRLRVCVVGSGPHFLSGISYFTHRLAAALGQGHDVSVILMRRLMPARWYPGRERVGQGLAEFSYPASVPLFNGVDWYWVLSMARAVRFLRRQHSQVLVLQWWTGTVLHSYLLLAWVAKRQGAQVVMEFHEVQDVGEARLPGVRAYVRLLLPRLLRLVDAAVVHSEFDRREVTSHYRLYDRPLVVIPHGPYPTEAAPEVGAEPPVCDRDGPCRLLYFGVIRRFKGVEDLLQAFETMDEEEAAQFRLHIVGETWEGWDLPARLIEQSRHRERIEFVNRYVTDQEAASAFAAADAAVLPYHRSSASGPLHMAMSRGLPVVVTAVGGLVEATEAYGGAVLVPPRDPTALRDGLRRVRQLRGRRFLDPHSWEHTAQRYDDLLTSITCS